MFVAICLYASGFEVNSFENSDYDSFDKEIHLKYLSCYEKKIKDNGYTLSTGFVGTGILNQTLL